MNNIGLLRIHETLADGWKPVMVEDGRREHVERMVGMVSPSRAQLSLAEKMMFGIAHEQYIEARPAHQLMTNDPAAVQTWQAVGKYNRFFRDHEDLYVGARSRAPLAIILDDHSTGVPLLDGLAARQVQFEVLYEKDLTATLLSRFKAVAILSAPIVRGSAIAALEEFVRKGGQLISAEKSATVDEQGTARQLPAFFRNTTGPGRGMHLEQVPPIEELAKILRAASASPIILEAPPGVLYNVTEQEDRRRAYRTHSQLHSGAGYKLEAGGCRHIPRRTRCISRRRRLVYNLVRIRVEERDNSDSTSANLHNACTRPVNSRNSEDITRSMRISISYLYTIFKYGYPHSVDDAIRSLDDIRKLGFRFLEMEGLGKENLREVYERRNELRNVLGGCGLHVHNFCVVDPDMVHVDPQIRQLALDRFQMGAEIAETIGSGDSPPRQLCSSGRLSSGQAISALRRQCLQV